MPIIFETHCKVEWLSIGAVLFSAAFLADMQHAKKLVLVDPKFLDQLQAGREYRYKQIPADALAETSLSLDIGRILREGTISIDNQAKVWYSDALRRYNNVGSKIPVEVKVEPNPLRPVLPPYPRAPEPSRRRMRHE